MGGGGNDYCGGSIKDSFCRWWVRIFLRRGEVARIVLAKASSIVLAGDRDENSFRGALVRIGSAKASSIILAGDRGKDCFDVSIEENPSGKAG